MRTTCSKLSRAVLIGLLACACTKKDFGVPRGPHRAAQEDEPERVKKPPPPAEVEVVPLRRNDTCLYMDGYYKPTQGTWIWQQGEWVVPPADCYYAPPETHYEKVTGGTTLVHRKGVWLKNKGSGLCEDAQPCPRLFGQ